MNTFKKTVLAIATVSTLAIAAAAPAQAGWEKPFVNGLGMGVGMGVGLGITNAILQPRPQTVVVQPVNTCRQVAAYNQFGQFIGYQTVC